MLRPEEKKMIEEVKSGVRGCIEKFLTPATSDAMRDFSNGIYQFTNCLEEMQRLRAGLTPGEPFYEFADAAVGYFGEAVAMMRLIEGSTRALMKANERFDGRLSDILKEN